MIDATTTTYLIKYRYFNLISERIDSGEFKVSRQQLNSVPLVEPLIKEELLRQGIEFAVIGRVEVEVAA